MTGDLPLIEALVGHLCMAGSLAYTIHIHTEQKASINHTYSYHTEETCAVSFWQCKRGAVRRGELRMKGVAKGNQ